MLSEHRLCAYAVTSSRYNTRRKGRKGKDDKRILSAPREANNMALGSSRWKTQCLLKHTSRMDAGWRPAGCWASPGWGKACSPWASLCLP